MGRLTAWVDRRFPFSVLVRTSMTEYYAPKNFNFWYFFGSLALLVFATQIISGILLLAHYQPSAKAAFNSVQSIMYDVKWGWLVRYIHTTGASLFFVVIYLHMLRGYLYGSFKRPRELLWLIGVALYVCLMGEAYFGYVLPFGNMSYWGGQVITSIIAAIPYVGGWLASVLRGSFGVGTPTLTRFVAFHAVLLPALLAVLILTHLLALHEVGSNNPDGVEIREHLDARGQPVDGIPFHPYYTVKDMFGVGVFLVVFCAIVFYAPTFHGLFIETYNFSPANPLKTPPEITPAWYLAPYYAMLRAVPNKAVGIGILFAAIIAPFLLPWLDHNPVKSSRYRPVYRWMVIVFVLTLVALGWIGMQPAIPALLPPARILLALYFLFFLSLPIVSRLEPTRPVPERISAS
ncbi:MAG: cytochrome bc complex cytochrome b subunit [Betaproteobacteria bacterium]|nr:cytochrome bc complex cytochrome b subunit [Betaproteobacteria bacterium]